MKAEGHIERNLLLLTGGAILIFTIFLVSFFWIQHSLTTNQQHKTTVVAPLNRATALLKAAFEDLYNQQNQVASTENSADVKKLGDRSAVEQKIQEARGLISAYPNFETLDQGLSALLETDQTFYQANLERRLWEEQLAQANQIVDGKLKNFQEASQGISGKIRFAHGSSVRQARRMVNAEGFTEEAQALIRQKILGPSQLQLGIVNDILSAASELNRLTGRISPSRTEDQVNSLIANELIQQRDKALVNIQDLQDEVKRQPELVAITRDLTNSLNTLSYDIVDLKNENSLISVKFKVLGAMKAAEQARRELERLNKSVGSQLTQLTEASDKMGHELDSNLSGVVAWARWILVLVVVLALVFGAVGGLAVERSVRILRRNNADLSHLKEELTTVNANLEQTIEERTRTIRTILDHVQFGFLLADRDLQIREGSTRSCEQLLQKEGLTGMKLSEALGLSHRQSQNFSLQLGQLFDDVMPESVVFSQVPSRFNVGGRTIRLQGSAVRDASGAIDQVLFCLMDISDLEQAENENRTNRILLNILRNPDQFRRFIADTHRGFQAAKTAVPQQDTDTVRRELHTIKGNLGVYELHAIARDIHLLEDQAHISQADLDRTEKTLAGFLGSHFDVLGISYEEQPTDTYRVNDRTLQAIEKYLADEKNIKTLREQLGLVIADIRMKPAKDLMGPLDELTRSLAQRFGKAVVFKTEGEGIRMDPDKVQPIFNVLPHLIRNSVDHGIEFPWERNGKPDDASLMLRFTEDTYSWTLTFTDDGRGINTEKLRERAVASGLLKADEKVSKTALNRLIFAANLSTAEVVSDVSGRGIGMSAVASAVKERGCSIDVTSEQGQGTRFEIIIPKKQRHLKSVVI